MDVDNESDYKEMVWKIHDTAGHPGAATKILVDMKHIERLPSRQVNGHSRDEELSGSDDNEVFDFFLLWLEWFLTWSPTSPHHLDQISTRVLLDGA